MLRSARSKIATKVAKIESIDDFQFSRWLRVPPIHEEEVYPLVSYDDVKEFEVEQLKLLSIFKLKFLIYKESLPEYKVKFKVDKPKAYLIFFGLARPQLFQMKEKFLKEPKLSDFNSKFIKDNDVVDQSDVFICKPANTIKYDYEFSNLETKHILLLIHETKTSDELKNISEPEISDQLKKIDLPIVTDHLASLVPEIYNIELLNNEKLENIIIDSKNYEVKKLKLPMVDKIEVPDISDIVKSYVKSVSIPVEKIASPDLKYFSPDLSASSQIFKVKIDSPKTIVKKVVVKQNNLEAKVIDPLNDKKFSSKRRDDIRILLSSYRELSWEEYSSSLSTLQPYELDGAKILAENNFAIYSEEVGYDKFNQTCSAINFLHKKGQAKSVLIVSDQARLKNYWTDALNSYAKGFTIRLINAESLEKITGYSTAWLLDINDLAKLDIKNFDQIDLLIFDEHINLKVIENIIDDFVNQLQPHYFWLLTSIASKKYNEKLLEKFSFSSKAEFNYFGRTLEEIQKDDPVVTYRDFWLEFDEMQSFEYAEALSQAKSELNKLAANPNPLRFQSNIFTIIHKLKQILNFSSFRNISPKANLLIEQAEAIYRNKRKAIVFTQYDDNGMKKIEKAFEMNNIKHIVARNGISTDDLKIALDNFYDRKEIPILLTNLKPSRLNINLNKISYIINFDQWWNPITNWQNEDEIGLNDIMNSPVFVFNYYIKNSFEEGLIKLLNEKGLVNKKLFDNIKSETVSELVQLDDWLAVFGINEGYFDKLRSEKEKLLKKLHALDLDEFKSLMRAFFSHLGFRDISIMDIADEQMFYIIGTARKGTTPVHLHGKCCLIPTVTKEDYEEVVYLKQGANEIKRKFVVANGTFNERIPNGTTYLDDNDLINYLFTLGLKSYLNKKKS
jgi:hypothetical protein